MASAAHQLSHPGTSYDRLADPAGLRAAWDHVRRSADASASPAIRAEARRFGDDLDRRLGRLALDLQADRFTFAPALGVAQERAGKRPRPIVVAPIESRVVARALLDALTATPAVAALAMSAPTSFGGLPGRGVPEAITAAVDAVRGGAAFHVRSDIADFFRAVPRDRAVAEIAAVIGDARMARLLDQATRTELANADDLGETAALFPGEQRGVAQGNALSTLLGNVVLRGFDAAMNGRGVVCLRYVDDFVLLGARAAHVRRAFTSAGRLLGELGMRAYDPATDPDKAARGHVASGITWLGCEIVGGAARPSRASQRALLARVERSLGEGARRGALATALARVEGTVRAYRATFGFCACPEVFAALDARIDRMVKRAWSRWGICPRPLARGR